MNKPNYQGRPVGRPPSDASRAEEARMELQCIFEWRVRELFALHTGKRLSNELLASFPKGSKEWFIARTLANRFDELIRETTVEDAGHRSLFDLLVETPLGSAA